MSDERIVEEFMGARPRAAQLHEWLITLRERTARLRQEAKTADPETAADLKGKLRRLEEQVAALEEEAAITEFVEDSVRVTLAMGAIVDQTGEDE